MTQQAKDIYSGIKKIFPSSRRSGSFSLGSGRPSSSTSELSAEALAAAQQEDYGASSSRDVGGEASKKKERRPSFSFSGWKERRSSLSTKKKEPTPPPVASSSATPAARPAAGGPYAHHQHIVTVPTPKADSSYLKTNGFTTTPTALSRSTSYPGHFPGTTSSLYDKPSAAAAASSSLLRTSSSVATVSSYQKHQPMMVSTRSTSASSNGTRPEPVASARGPSNNQQDAQQGPAPALKSSLKPHSDSRSSRSQSIVPELPTKSQLNARAHRSSYNVTSSSNSQISAATAEKSSSSSASRMNSYSTANIGPRPVAKEEKKRRFSFSRHKNASTAMDDVAMIVKKPHANTWDSDSDDDYEDTRRPTRGLDRRSVSMDFVEQNPTHLISKIWRKLPIQARLYSGRGSIDLDMQKDRNSFSRSSTAKQQAEKLGQSNYNKPPSPLPNANMFGDKHIYFNQKIVYFPAEGGYIALESYDDVLVRVCLFPDHDTRRTATKVQEFLERSMAFLHGTKTKHGNVVSISNEEIRMWRRLARHDWNLEAVTRVQDLPVDHQKTEKERPLEKDSRSSSAVTAESDSDSDDQRRRKAAAASAGKENVNPEDNEEDEDADLALPKGLNLRPLVGVVNSCVNFGEYLFSFEEIDELVRLEYLVEEDGWI